MYPDTRYVIDGAVELGHLTPMEYAAASHDPQVAGEIDRWVGGMVGDYEPECLPNLCREGLERAPRELLYAFALKAVDWVPEMLRSLQERANLVVRDKVLHDLGEMPASSFPGLWDTQLSAPEPKVFHGYADVLPDKVRTVVEGRCAGLLARWQTDLSLMEEATAWAAADPTGGRRDMAGQLLAGRRGIQDFGQMVATAAPASRKRIAYERSRHRTARAAIKKALKLFQRTERLESVTALISGKEVEVSHASSAFKFILVPYEAGWLERRTLQAGGTAPFTIKLFTKTDIHLANLCVYFPETPVLDQLFAMMLFIQSGEESELLKTANWFGVAKPAEVASQLIANGSTDLLSRIGYLPDGTPGRAPKQGQADGARQIVVRLPVEMEKWEPYYGPVNQWLQSMLIPNRFGHLFEMRPRAAALAAA
jgi:hypothetical protein